MVEGSPVTCSSCNLKYLSRASGACPRCQTPDAESTPGASGPRPSAALAPSASPSLSPAAPPDRKPVTPLIVVGLSLVALVGAAAVWSRSKQGSGASAEASTAVECYKIDKIVARGNAAMKRIDQISKGRSPEMNLLMTFTDVAKELDGVAAEIDAVSFVDPSMKEAASDYARVLRNVAELARSAMVTIRARDGQQWEKITRKLDQARQDEKETFGRIAARCKDL